MLEDRVVLVTGAGTGIGSAIAREFCQAGARVVLAGRRRETLEQVASHLPEDRTLCFTCDVSDRAAVNTMVDRVKSDFGEVELLVNNAGMNTQQRAVGDVDPGEWDSLDSHMPR